MWFIEIIKPLINWRICCCSGGLGCSGSLFTPCCWKQCRTASKTQQAAATPPPPTHLLRDHSTVRTALPMGEAPTTQIPTFGTWEIRKNVVKKKNKQPVTMPGTLFFLADTPQQQIAAPGSGALILSLLAMFSSSCHVLHPTLLSTSLLSGIFPLHFVSPASCASPLWGDCTSTNLKAKIIHIKSSEKALGLCPCTFSSLQYSSSKHYIFYPPKAMLKMEEKKEKKKQ